MANFIVGYFEGQKAEWEYLAKFYSITLGNHSFQRRHPPLRKGDLARTKLSSVPQVKDEGDCELTRRIGGNAEMKLALKLSKRKFVRYLQVIDCDRLRSSSNRPKFGVFGFKSFFNGWKWSALRL